MSKRKATRRNGWYGVMMLALASVLIGVDGSIFLRVGDTNSTRQLLVELCIILVMMFMLRVRRVLFWHGWLALGIVLIGAGVTCILQVVQTGWTSVTLTLALHAGVIALCVSARVLFWPVPLSWRVKGWPGAPRR